MCKRIKMNYNASKENLEAAIKQLIRIKEIPLEEFNYYGSLEGCSLCRSVGVYSRSDNLKCRECVLGIYPEPSFLRLGCFDGWKDSDTTYKLLDTLYVISEQECANVLNTFYEELVEAIRFNLPEFISLCESKGVDVPENLLRLYQIRRQL